MKKNITHVIKPKQKNFKKVSNFCFLKTQKSDDWMITELKNN